MIFTRRILVALCALVILVPLAAQEPAPEDATPGFNREEPYVSWPQTPRPRLSASIYKAPAESFMVDRLRLTGPVEITMGMPDGFVVDYSDPRYSVLFVNRNQPACRAGISIFRAGELIPDASMESLRAYVNGLHLAAEKDTAAELEILHDFDLNQRRPRFMYLGKIPRDLIYIQRNPITGEAIQRLEGWFMEDDLIYCVTYENDPELFETMASHVRLMLSRMHFAEE
ncbi:MAG: hypothetical protein ACOCVG_04580 [Verrucomicrobiota bacterium]